MKSGARLIGGATDMNVLCTEERDKRCIETCLDTVV